MGLFSGTSAGIEIGANGITAAVVSKRSGRVSLERLSSSPAPPETFRFALKEPNILDQRMFTDAVRDAVNRLLMPVRSASLSLPDSVGRIILMDIEERFKNRQEGIDVLKWKLKKSLPFEPSDTHLDFQILKIRESGETSVLAAVISRSVISQYEELFESLGIALSRIDFSGFNVIRPFHDLLPEEGDIAFTWYYSGVLGLMFVVDGNPEFIRFKELPGIQKIDGRMFMEVNSSLLVFRERMPERMPKKVFALAPPALAEDFCSMIEEATGAESMLLEIKKLLLPADSVPADQPSLFPFSGAIGAALRNL